MRGPLDVYPELVPFIPKGPHSAQQKLPPDLARKAHFIAGKAEVQRRPGHSQCYPASSNHSLASV